MRSGSCLGKFNCRVRRVTLYSYRANSAARLSKTGGNQAISVSLLTFPLRRRPFTQPTVPILAMNNLPNWTRALRSSSSRSFHASSSTRSHIGSAPIPIPPSVTVTLPTSSISPTLPLSSPSARRFVSITGPLGSETVPILPPVILAQNAAALTVAVHDLEEKSQRSLWGLTRSLINNAVAGVSTGYTLDLRLVGVGYRANVEPIPQVFLDLQGQMPRIARPSKPGAPPYSLPPLPTERLNLKLGYAHPVLIDIPTGITVTTPSPTRIVLAGIDKQKLGLFAAKIRRWRKPEPYRGKVRSAAHG